MKRVGTRGYSSDLRERIVAAVAQGKTVAETAEQFRVQVRTVKLYLNKQQQGTLHLTGRSTGCPCTVQTVHEQQLLKQLDNHRDATLVEHAQMLEEATGLNVSFKTVDRVFRRHKITHKKNAGRQRTA